MGRDRHIRVIIENEKEKYPNLIYSYRGKRRYTLYTTRNDSHWSGTESLSLRDLEIIRDYITEYINNEKSKKGDKK